MPAAAIPMVAPQADAPPPGPATNRPAVADPRGPLRLTDPGEADLWLGRAVRHYRRDRRLSHASRALALMLAGYLSPIEARRWTGRWYPAD